jgi:hypothetical protein
MQFTTQIPILQSNHPIDYNSRVVCLGSCFAVNIGQKFDYFKFRNITNPFGILFSPTALEKFISFAVNQKQFTEADIFFHNERWHCFDAHSDLSSTGKEVLLHNLNAAVTTAHKALQSATHVIITLGTAWVYRYIETGNIVANCHKVPQKQFNKELLSVDAIKYNIENILNLIQHINPQVHFTFTISPVRHIKDGFVENQRSKSNLISALHEVLTTEHCQLNTDYFPSYEIMMDELRDYRFYAEDMIHPNQIAINYIWERFTKACITPEAQATMQQVDAVQKGLQHRPFNADSVQHINFLEKLQEKIVVLQKQHSHIIF